MKSEWDSFITTKRKKRNCCILFFFIGIIFTIIFYELFLF
jgi:hypothetical protein